MPDENWTESALLQGVSDDAETAFVVRLQRHPARRTDWLWLHAFAPGESYGYTDDRLAGTDEVTDVEAPSITYRVGSRDGPFAELGREGPRANPSRVEVQARAWTYRGTDGPPGPGLTALRLSAEFVPDQPPGASLPGRSEVLGVVKASMEISGRKVAVRGRGHWHEQHQHAVRFTTPFTYLSLAGAGLSVVAIRAPGGSRGFARIADRLLTVVRFQISKTGPRRAVTFDLDDGSRLEGVLEATYRYTIALAEGRRPGSVVRGGVGGEYVVGTVNDWMEDAFPPEIER